MRDKVDKNEEDEVDWSSCSAKIGLATTALIEGYVRDAADDLRAAIS